MLLTTVATQCLPCLGGVIQEFLCPSAYMAFQGLKELCRGSSMSRDVLPLQQAACRGLSMTHNQHDQAQCKAADTSSHDW